MWLSLFQKLYNGVVDKKSSMDDANMLGARIIPKAKVG
jgi:hypothetical protein